MYERKINHVLVTSRTYDSDDMLTVDNGFFAGSWGSIDGCGSASFANSLQLKVNVKIYFLLYKYPCQRPLNILPSLPVLLDCVFNQMVIEIFWLIQFGDTFFDDYGVTTVYLFCRHVMTHADTGTITSAALDWEDWGGRRYCSRTHIFL